MPIVKDFDKQSTHSIDSPTEEHESTSPNTNDYEKKNLLLIVDHEHSSIASKRYCFGKMKKIPFIIFVTFTTIIVAIALLIAIAYLYLLPKFIPHLFWASAFGEGVGGIRLDKLGWLDETERGVHLDLHMSAPNLQLPVSFFYSEMTEPKFYWKSRENGRVFAEFNTNHNLFINGKDATIFDLPNYPENTKEYINSLANWINQGNQSSSSIKHPNLIEIECHSDVSFMSIPMYNVDFYHSQDLEFSTVRSKIGNSLIARLASLEAYDTQNGAFGGHSSALMAGEKSPAFDRRTLLGPFTVQNLSAVVDSHGIAVTAISKFGGDNGLQPFDLKIKELGFSVHLDQVKVAKFAATGIELVHNKQTFSLKAGLYPDINPADVPSLVKTGGKIAAGEFTGSFIGIRDIVIHSDVSNEHWLQKIFGGIDITLPVENFQPDISAPSGPSSTGLSTLSSIFTINGITVDLQKNDTIKISSNLTLTNAIDANLTISPFTAFVSNDAGSKLLSVSLSEINIVGFSDNKISPEIIINLQNSDVAADSLGKVLQDALNMKESMISIGPIVFNDVSKNATANSMQNTNIVFSLIRFRLPVSKLIFATRGPIVELGAANVANLEAETPVLPPQLELSLIDGALRAGKDSLTVNLNSNLISQLPLTVNIPYISARLGVDSLNAVKLELTNLSIKKGSQDMNSALSISFGTDQQLPSTLGGLVTSFLRKEAFENNGVVQGFRFGPSKESSYNLFDRLNIVVSGPNLLALLMPPAVVPAVPEPVASAAQQFFKLNLFKGLSDLTLAKTNPVVNGLDLTTVSPATVTLGLGASFSNPLPISLDIPYVQIQLLLEKSRMVTLSLQGLKATTMANSASLKLSAGFSNEGNILDSVSKVVDGFLKNGDFGVDVSISGFIVGLTSEDSIKALSMVQLPIAAPVPSTDSSSSSPLDFKTIFPWLNGLTLDSFAPKLKTADLSTVNEGLRGIVAGSINNVAPVSISIGTLEVDVVIEGSELTKISLSGLNIVRGQQDASVTLLLSVTKDGSSAKEKFANLVSNYLAGKPASITITDARIGTTGQDSIQTFSKCSLPLTLPALSSSSPSTLPSTGTSLPGIFAGFGIDKIDALDLSTTANGLDVGFQGVLSNPTPFSVNLGYVSIDILLKGAGRLAKIELGLVAPRGKSASSLTIKTTLAKSGGNFPELVKAIYDSYLAKTASNEVAISGFTFGVTSDSSFDAFSMVKIDIPLPFNTMQSLLPGSSNSTAPGIPSGFIPKITKLDVTTTNIGFSGVIGLQINNLPINIRLNIGYLSLSLFLSDALLGSISANNIKIAGASVQNLDVPVSFIISPEDPSAAQTIADVVNPFLAGNAIPVVTAGIGGLTFGNSAIQSFDFLSLIVLTQNFDLKALPSPSTAPPVTDGGGPFSNFSITKLDFSTVDEGISLKAGLELGAFGIPITAHVGYLSLDATLLQNRLAKLVINSFNAKPILNSKMSIDVSAMAVLLPEDPQIADKIASILNPIFADLANGVNSTAVKSITFGFRNIIFGNSPSNTFNLLSKVNAEFVKPFSVPSTPGTPSNSTSPPMFAITGIDFKTNDIGLALDVKASLASLGFPQVTANVGLLYVDLKIQTPKNPIVRIARIAGSNIGISGGGVNDLHIPVVADFANYDPAVQDEITSIIDATLSSQTVLNGTLVSLTGLSFGKDVNHVATLFSKVVLSIDAGALLHGTHTNTTTVAQGSLDDLPFSLTSIEGSFDDDAVLSVDVGFKIKNPPDISITGTMGYVGVDAAIAGFKVGSFRLINAQIGAGGQINARLELDFVNTLEVAGKVRELYGCTLQSTCTKDLLVVQNVRFGVSPEQNLDLLSKVKYLVDFHMDLDILLKDAHKSNELNRLTVPQGIVADSSFADILVKWSAELGFISTGINGNLKVELNTTIPVDINFGWGQLLFQQNDFVNPAFNIFSITAQNVRFTNKAPQTIGVNVQADASKHIPIVLGDILKSIYMSSEYLFYGFRFGKSKETPVQILSQVPVYGFMVQHAIAKQPTGTIPIGLAFKGVNFIPTGLNFDVSNSIPITLNLGKFSLALLFDDKGDLKNDLNIEIYNQGDSSKLEIYGQDVSKLLFEFKLHWSLAWHILKNLAHLHQLLANFYLDSPAIDGAAWFTDSFKGWRLKLSDFMTKFTPNSMATNEMAMLSAQVLNVTTDFNDGDDLRLSSLQNVTITKADVEQLLIDSKDNLKPI